MSTAIPPFIRSLSGERSHTVMAAIYRDRLSAERVALRLLNGVSAPGSVALLAPGDPLVARRIENEPAGIGRTALRSHLILGAAGVAVGLATAAALVAGNVAGAAWSPGMTAWFAGVVGGYFGLLAAGLVTLRPDHARVIRRVREALHQRRWAVVVRPRTADQTRRSWQLLQASGGTRLRSF